MSRNKKTKIIYNLNFDKMSKSEIEDIITNAIIKADEKQSNKFPREKEKKVSTIKAIKNIWNLRKEEFVSNNKKMVDCALITGVELLIKLTIFIFKILLVINVGTVVMYNIFYILKNPFPLNVILGVISILVSIFAAILYIIILNFLDKCLSNYSYKLSDLSIFGATLISFVALLVAISSNGNIYSSAKDIFENPTSVIEKTIQNTYQGNSCDFFSHINN